MYSTDMITRKEDRLQSKGTVKAAVLENDSKCKGLIVLSFYDSKPFYFVTKACKNIQWIKKLASFIIKKKVRK